ncbi:MAG: hypothetical protein GQ474_00560 [Sulfurimonas sp.]|nr:hypothetical protein [Sulfurimonas sp.]
MKKTLTIDKEFYKTVDAGSNEFMVEVYGEGFALKGYARNIFEGNTFHLDSEFENLLENNGFDAYEIRDALEEGVSTLTVEVKDIKIDLKRFLELAVGVERYDLVKFLSECLISANQSDLYTLDDFGGTRVEIDECFNEVNKALEASTQKDVDAMELFEAEKLRKLDYEV